MPCDYQMIKSYAAPMCFSRARPRAPRPRWVPTAWMSVEPRSAS